MSASAIWLLLGAILGSLELLTGTFYLLAIAVGCLAGALCAWLGIGQAWQLLVAALLALIAAFVLRKVRSRLAANDPQKDDDDIGQQVEIISWQDENRARVQYRGSQWNARLAEGVLKQDKAFWIIVAREGTTLIITVL